jgi:hypothetical protein
MLLLNVVLVLSLLLHGLHLLLQVICVSRICHLQKTGLIRAGRVCVAGSVAGGRAGLGESMARVEALSVGT